MQVPSAMATTQSAFDAMGGMFGAAMHAPSVDLNNNRNTDTATIINGNSSQKHCESKYSGQHEVGAAVSPPSSVNLSLNLNPFTPNDCHAAPHTQTWPSLAAELQQEQQQPQVQLITRQAEHLAALLPISMHQQHPQQLYQHQHQQQPLSAHYAQPDRETHEQLLHDQHNLHQPQHQHLADSAAALTSFAQRDVAEDSFAASAATASAVSTLVSFVRLALSDARRCV